MEILKDAKSVKIEPAENGVIVYAQSGRDPYTQQGEVAEPMVFTSMEELVKFLKRNFLATNELREIFAKDINDDDKAVGRTPKLDLYDIKDEVFGGGS